MAEETPKATIGTTPGRTEAARATKERSFSSSTETDAAVEDHQIPDHLSPPRFGRKCCLVGQH